jgi:hypothetical protein
VLVVGAAAWYHFVFGGFALPGSVVDSTSGKPIAGARVWSADSSSSANPEGEFVLAVKPPEPVSVDAAGYLSSSVRVLTPMEPLQLALQPIALELEVVDSETGQTVANPSVTGVESVAPTGSGRFRLSPMRPGAPFQVTANGYLPRDVNYAGAAMQQVRLDPRMVGRVTDAATGKPLRGVRIQVDGDVLRTDSDGMYRLTRRIPDASLTFLAPGYKRANLPMRSWPALDVQMQPNEVRAMYMTYYAAGHPDYRRRMFELLDTTELNAVVIDVKGDRGYLAYTSRVPLADTIGANEYPTMEDVDQLLSGLRERGVYAIARIVVFKDDLLAHNGARAGLDVAIKDRRSGQPWVDNEGLAWADGFQTAAWDYNIALAREAIERGFDEVQFDYIRFPTDAPPGGTIDDTIYSKPFTEANRVDAIRTFLGRARAAVNGAGGYLGIDTFGYTTWWTGMDGGIGQDLAVLVDEVDYFCPMVYPSTFNSGIPGGMNYPEVVRQPYHVVYSSLNNVVERALDRQSAVLRPWLQYFDDYGALDGYRYEATHVEAQKKAVADAKAFGWMLWDPTNEYRRGGLAPRSVVAATR